MALYRVEALVLRSRELGEADRVVTLYARTEGKLRAVARGSRRPRSRLMGPTQPFCHGRYLLMSGRELDTITQAELFGNGLRPLREDLTRMTMASLTAELVDALVEERSASEPLFQALLTAWQELARQEAGQLEMVLWWFELRLLDLLGYGAALDRCAGCGGPLGVGEVLFSPAEGGCLCQRCRARDPLAGPLSLQARQTLLALRGSSGRDLGAHGLQEREAEQVRQALGSFVEYHLPGRLRSLSVAQALAGDEQWAVPVWRGGDGGGSGR